MSLDPLYIVDLNEYEDGRLPVSIDFTKEYGPWVTPPGLTVPELGEEVWLWYDEDDMICLGTVSEIVSERDFIVNVDWRYAQWVV